MLTRKTLDRGLVACSVLALVGCGFLGGSSNDWPTVSAQAQSAGLTVTHEDLTQRYAWQGGEIVGRVTQASAGLMQELTRSGSFPSEKSVADALRSSKSLLPDLAAACSQPHIRPLSNAAAACRRVQDLEGTVTVLNMAARAEAQAGHWDRWRDYLRYCAFIGRWVQEQPAWGTVTTVEDVVRSVCLFIDFDLAASHAPPRAVQGASELMEALPGQADLRTILDAEALRLGEAARNPLAPQSEDPDRPEPTARDPFPPTPSLETATSELRVMTQVRKALGSSTSLDQQTDRALAALDRIPDSPERKGYAEQWKNRLLMFRKSWEASRRQRRLTYLLISLYNARQPDGRFPQEAPQTTFRAAGNEKFDYLSTGKGFKVSLRFTEGEPCTRVGYSDVGPSFWYDPDTPSQF